MADQVGRMAGEPTRLEDLAECVEVLATAICAMHHDDVFAHRRPSLFRTTAARLVVPTELSRPLP